MKKERENMFESCAPDGWGCRSDLQDALSDDRLNEFLDVLPEQACSDTFQPSPAGQSAASRVAESLGYCRLFATELGELEGPLPVSLALAAGQHLLLTLQEAIQETETLEEDWLRASSFERQDMCATMLESRMGAWATFVALDESQASCIEKTSFEPTRLLSLIEQLDERIDEFDTALQGHTNTLTTIVDLPLLGNWRNFLSDEFQILLPWWLDGTIERVAADIEREALALLPDQETFKRRMQS